jgi:predicted transcriptional regulator
VKTAISLPDDLFAAAEVLAGRLGLSRSQLYATALARFVAEQERAGLTARLNAVYAGAPDDAPEDAAEDAAEREWLARAQAYTLRAAEPTPAPTDGW